jgi:hypothetical protein
LEELTAGGVLLLVQNDITLAGPGFVIVLFCSTDRFNFEKLRDLYKL